jgi:hypothetical protein
MTPEVSALVTRHVGTVDHFDNGEAALLPHLMRWLVVTGRLRGRTEVAFEVPWLGRRVDLALLSGRGVTSAFELKIGRLQRALEQAAYNRSSFHRSWVVTGNRPQAQGLEWARSLGVGLVVVQPPEVTLVLLPSARTPERSVRHRVRSAIAARAVAIA